MGMMNQTMMDEDLETYRRLQQMRRPGVGFYLWMMTLKLLKLLAKTLWFFRITVLWTVGTAMTLNQHELQYGRLAFTWMSLIPLVLLLAILLRSYRNRGALKLLPLIGDVFRQYLRRLDAMEYKRGRDFIVNSGLMSEELAQQREPKVRLTEESDGNWKLKIEEPLIGVSAQSLLTRADEFKDQLDALRVSYKKGSRGKGEVIFWVQDPLDEAVQRDEPGDLNEDKMKVECARDEWGKTTRIEFGGAAGMIVGGEPGSGKTAGTSSFLLPLALSSNVNLTVIDCKGGDDWTAYQSRSDRFIKGSDDNLDEIEELLEQKVRLMNSRLQTLKPSIGEANFWNADAQTRLNAGVNMELIVIDECQDLFSDQGLDKDEKAQVQRITRYITQLVKKGRSSGMFTILITQKPTADSIPSSISSNCGVKIAFRLSTSAAETATLGARPEGSASALDIPMGRKGGAVMSVEGEGIVPVRFYYIHEDVQKQLLEA